MHAVNTGAHEPLKAASSCTPGKYQTTFFPPLRLRNKATHCAQCAQCADRNLCNLVLVSIYNIMYFATALHVSCNFSSLLVATCTRGYPCTFWSALLRKFIETVCILCKVEFSEYILDERLEHHMCVLEQCPDVHDEPIETDVY